MLGAGSPMLSRWWKTARAALVFTYFYVGGACVGLFVLPVVALVVRDETTRIRRSNRIVSGCFRFTLTLLRLAGIVDLDPDRVRLADPGRQVLVVVNHPTTMDVVAVLAVMRDAVVVIKDKIWRDPFLRFLFRWLGHVHGGDGTLESNLAVVAAVETRIAQGFTVVIFPEGTRSPAGGLAPMAKGAFAIATRTALDVHPLLIRCEPPILHRDAPWHDLPEAPARYRLESLPIVASGGASTRQLQGRVVSAYESALGLRSST